MEQRTRTRTRTFLGGIRTYIPKTVWEEQGPVVETYKETTDWYKKKNRPDGSLPPTDFLTFEIDNRRLPRMTLDRPETVQTWHRVRNWVVGEAPDAVPPGGWRNLEGSDDFLVAKLLAESNPFRSTVSVPIMVAELIEAASLFAVNWATPLTLAGSSYLNVKFGWETMQADIKDLADITKTIERRIKEFNSLVEKGGLRRKIFLKSGQVEWGEKWRQTAYSFGQFSFSHLWDAVWTTKVHGTVRWRPTRTAKIPTDKLEVFNLAVANVFDLERPDPATVWEMIPFSWLVDYFSTFGDVLRSLESGDLVEPYDICIVRERRSTRQWYPNAFRDEDGSGFITKGESVRTEKKRTVHDGSALQLLAWDWELTPKQATTLAALLVKRRLPLPK